MLNYQKKDRTELEAQIRNLLQKEKMKISAISKQLNLYYQDIDATTVWMYDVAEEDNGLLFLINKKYPRIPIQKKYCLFCNKELTNIKRSSKKFCGHNCQVTYNNQRLKMQRKMKKKIKSGEVLKDICTNNNSTLQRLLK